MKETVDLTNYRKAHKYAVSKLSEWYSQYEHEENINDFLWNEFRKWSLDPDGKAIRVYRDTTCTADSMISIYRSCTMERFKDKIIPTYEYYSYVPIFYFPMEMGGINQTRARVYGDRIDYTLYDLKLALESGVDNCRLLSAYKKPITGRWLSDMQCFDNLIDWYDIGGIFTDKNNQVINIETGNIITELPSATPFSKGWSIDYYSNLKMCIDAWYNAQHISVK